MFELDGLSEELLILALFPLMILNYDSYYLFQNSSLSNWELYSYLVSLIFFHFFIIAIGFFVFWFLLFFVKNSSEFERLGHVVGVTIGVYGFLYTSIWIKLEIYYGSPYWRFDLLAIFLVTLFASLTLSYFFLITVSYVSKYHIYKVITFLLLLILFFQPYYLGYSLPDRSQTKVKHKRPNVIFINVCTLGAKHLELYGHDKETAPNLTDFANNNINFTRAFSAAPWTRPSMASIHTGLYPPNHGTFKLQSKLPRGIPVIAERFYSNGYQTMGITTNHNISSYFGFNRGFQYYVDDHPSVIGLSPIVQFLKKIDLLGFNLYKILSKSKESNRPDRARKVNQLAKKRIENRRNAQNPFFLYLQYIDPHDPYDPPDEYLNSEMLHPERNFGKEFIETDNGIYPFSTIDSTPEHIMKERIHRYHGEIRYWDAQFKNLIKYLKQNSIYKDSLIVLTADHGEEFLEHGHWKHGQSVFNELIHVPLVIKTPEDYDIAPQKIDTPVSTLDIKPTFVELLNLGKTSESQGESLTSLFIPESEGEDEFSKRNIYSMEPGSRKNHEIYSLIRGRMKIHRISNGKRIAWRLYDLQSDFYEQNDVSNQNPELFKGMKKKLNKWIKVSKESRVDAGTAKLKGKVRKKLEGLGYIE